MRQKRRMIDYGVASIACGESLATSESQPPVPANMAVLAWMAPILIYLEVCKNEWFKMNALALKNEATDLWKEGDLTE